MPITIFQNLNINSWNNDNIIDCGNASIKPTDELLDFDDFEIVFLGDENIDKKLNNNYTSNKNRYDKNEYNRQKKRFISCNNKIIPGNKKLPNIYYKSNTYTEEQKKISYNRILPTQKTTSYKKLHRCINTYYNK
jgi:hypothetical protein